MRRAGSWRTSAAGWVVLAAWVALGFGNVILGKEVAEDQISGIFAALQAVGIESSRELIELAAALLAGLASKWGFSNARDDLVSSEEARRIAELKGKA
jgi:uncharacterized membrane protein YjdF